MVTRLNPHLGFTRLQKQIGFTLIEILVVLSVMMLLVGVVAPAYFARLQTAKEVVLEQNLATMRSAIDKFHADRGRFPKKIAELVEQRYINRLPVDPLTSSDQTWIEQQPGQGEPNAEGVANVRSGAEGSNSAGVPFNEL
jgi:general secretion pathway protein G